MAMAIAMAMVEPDSRADRGEEGNDIAPHLLRASTYLPKTHTLRHCYRRHCRFVGILRIPSKSINRSLVPESLRHSTACLHECVMLDHVSARQRYDGRILLWSFTNLISELASYIPEENLLPPIHCITFQLWSLRCSTHRNVLIIIQRKSHIEDSVCQKFHFFYELILLLAINFSLSRLHLYSRNRKLEQLSNLSNQI